MFDIEKFIFEVEKRPALYDIKRKDYSNSQIKAKCWTEIGEAMYDQWHLMTYKEQDYKGKELIKKWEAIRDNFVREYGLLKKSETSQPATKRKKYVHFDQLLFLLPHLKGNENIFSCITPLEDTFHLDSLTEQAYQPFTDQPLQQQHTFLTKDPGSDSEWNRTRVKEGVMSSTHLTAILQESVSLQKEEMSSDKYGNKAFMLSFVPIMDNLPQHLFLQIRMKITDIFNDFVANNIPPKTCSLCSSQFRSSSAGTSPESMSTLLTEQTESENLNILENMKSEIVIKEEIIEDYCETSNRVFVQDSLVESEELTCPEASLNLEVENNETSKDLNVSKFSSEFTHKNEKAISNKYVKKQCRRRRKWSERDLCKAIESIRNGTSVQQASIEFEIPRKTLERRWKSGNIVKGPLGRHCVLGENEERLVRHIKKVQEQGFSVIQCDLRILAYFFACQLGVKHNFNSDAQEAGYDWLRQFLLRHPDLAIPKSRGVSVARGLAANREEVNSYFERLSHVLEENKLLDKPSSVFNMEEVLLKFNNRPGEAITEKESKFVSRVTSTEKGETITVVACCNSEGVFIPPFFIMKETNKKKEFEDGMPPGAVVYITEKLQIVKTCSFLYWLKYQFSPRKPAGKVVLILAGLKSHHISVESLEFAESNDIALICLPSRTTYHLNPLDQTVLKLCNFHKSTSTCVKKHPDYELTRLQFEELISECWGKSFVPGFRATGIYPYPGLNSDFIFVKAKNT